MSHSIWCPECDVYQIKMGNTNVMSEVSEVVCTSGATLHTLQHATPYIRDSKLPPTAAFHYSTPSPLTKGPFTVYSPESQANLVVAAAGSSVRSSPLALGRNRLSDCYEMVKDIGGSDWFGIATCPSGVG